ncbi:hypothetical protein H9L17_04795 [Thermomonas brevis]|uniref:Uncharacterized protein n=1 Tax=Thermomonas brevis TaxID=215691 RepID=A0A7G9QVT4_9GAMM|nr:hypothetical protein [Thermomonas brevis]QNN47459.1 hypothetical protein H9L17_04795 [Thermomonas brevis]
MIDTSNIDIAITMTDDDFIAIAEQGDAGPIINVVEVKDRGWAIYGPSGVYAADGVRTYSDLAEVHRLISGWGIKQFVQGQVVLALP